MGDSDDGLMLNLTPFVPKENTVAKKNTELTKKKKELTSVKSENDRKTKTRHSGFAKEKNYVDAKDFTPISTLFNKNPEIPVAPKTETTNKYQEFVFTSDRIDDLPINSRLRSNLKDHFKFQTLTKVQKLGIPSILQGNDVLIKAPTGSGKTMCYSVPIIDKLTNVKPPVSRTDGPYAIIMVPTRELALQTYNVIQDLCKSCISIIPGLLIGGEKCKSEKARLRKGVNIIVATPGRLLYHLKETSCLAVSRVSNIVLDEADKLLDMGFEKTVKEIIGELDKRGSVSRQSVLLSATLTGDIKELASFVLGNPIFVDSEVDDSKSLVDHSDFIIPGSLEQYFVTVPAKLRLIALLTFVIKKVLLKENKCKAMVFISNINSANLMSDVLKLVLESYFKVSSSVQKNVRTLHGDMLQADRVKTFEEFKQSEFGVLFCTDVAARGLDIKGVNWIIQYSCPTVIKDYLHRIGRTARIGEKGKSLLFILPSEIQYISLLSKRDVVLQEIKLADVLCHFLSNKELKSSSSTRKAEQKATELQSFIEEGIVKSTTLQQKAVQAYKSYIQSYATYPSSLKHVFHVKFLHLGHVAKSFGLREAPKKISGQANTIVMKRQRVFEEEKLCKEEMKKKKMKYNLEMADGIFTGPRPGKQKITSVKRPKIKGKKRKHRI